ncbi:T9SS type A sorting domain-containing protein [Flavilitoribacter nigricans]|uniref:T9SS type A sorting domain-containing protein n=1 Tax=Flavilitoribacter nigricans (strain ATCC 23147 / DSM 23189 / NBRC 102662 / NCIMB 1420 / SS-2) TaxID=1122177 RepID=A0A2D0N2W8_FLAN2|nr:T9SS type A sorting domain-containing protein [Flavilitoribacter nigricans]PHN02797.1 hypothetical protein CRP01_29890 [Flavilitoribacter nigricans DSM 23189 = NBRC 102662]
MKNKTCFNYRQVRYNFRKLAARLHRLLKSGRFFSIPYRHRTALLRRLLRYARRLSVPASFSVLCNFNPLTAVAQPIAGPDFVANTYTEGNQGNSVCGMDAQGNVVVVWLGSGTANATKDGIWGQRFSALGELVGTEFPLNMPGETGHSELKMAMADNGDFVITSTQSKPSGDQLDIYARCFFADGTPKGDEFRVNTTTANDQSNSAVAMNADGDFVVSWQSAENAGAETDVYARIYNANGSPKIGEVLVNTVTEGDQHSPTAGLHDDGDFVVAWSGAGPPTDTGIYAQRFNAFGTKMGGAFLVNSDPATPSFFPHLATGSDGNFIITYSKGQDPSTENEVFFQRFTFVGEKLGPETSVGFHNDPSAQQARIGIDDCGNFFILWLHEDPQTSGKQLYGQYYNREGIPYGPITTVNDSPEAGILVAPSIAMGATGDFVAVYSSDDGNALTDVQARIFARETRLTTGTETRINSYTKNDQQNPDVAVDGLGNTFVVWESTDGQDYPGPGVFAQRYGADGMRSGPEFQVHTTPPAFQTLPAVGSNASGQAVVVWQGKDPEDDLRIIVYGQRYQSDGSTDGDEFVIANVSSSPTEPAVDMQDDGSFIAVWGADGDTNTPLDVDIYGRLYDPSGNPLGPAFKANTDTVENQVFPDVAMDNDGDFIVSWHSRYFYVKAQRFDSSGNKVGGEIAVNDLSFNYQGEPVIGMSDNSDIVAAWSSSGVDGSAHGVLTKTFAAGEVPGSDQLVNTETEFDQSGTAVSMDGAGNFVILWRSGGPGLAHSGIQGQRFAQNGQRIGENFKLDIASEYAKHEPVVAMDQQGGFTAVWTSFDQDCSGRGIFGRRFTNEEAGCPSGSLVLQGNESVGAEHLSAQMISSVQEIGAGASVDYQAGHSIRLLPGFSVAQGAQFSARVADCEPGVSMLPANALPANTAAPLAGTHSPESGFSIYPNPAGEQIQLDLPAALTIQKIELWNLFGKKMGTYGPATRTVPLQGLSPGNYLLIVHTATQSLRQHFVKQ